MKHFEEDQMSALEAIQEAQRIAFAPMVFQATLALRNLGILEYLAQHLDGYTFEQIQQQTHLPLYGLRVLLEAGLGIKLLTYRDNVYKITKLGIFILQDTMTRVNMDFSQDVCYQGLFTLQESITTEKPTGLSVFGNWKTVYEALAHLPPQVQKSWFGFDHFYSDGSFPLAIPLVAKYKPTYIYDIGGNTGKFTLQYLKAYPQTQIGIVDLPGQLEMAKKNIREYCADGQVTFIERNMLDEFQKLPKGADAIWMSQFLDCFSEQEITSILQRCYDVLETGNHVFILETFWDTQRFEVAAFSLQMTSLYFTNIANGNSQMYHSELFKELIRKIGFHIIEEIHEIGISHTLLVCEKI